ncbi:MAG: type I-C CRISPR-associated protein Cas7/Csd2 [Caldilineaceae bacterium SB0675_bin_29]|uniref:Type I-C CRISPR-associated protein Cas7/Csd2 n=1 Tax=Caldilineaceae bacterium SB0675_bin_29 TaxID=2605266 RepID=A0A6B1G0E2_9CHLR|nr:type I-C CRISPR-associated protein Cas7/Csd2 [Caldilineaceae bacterium SB0675_bin_29]
MNSIQGRYDFVYFFDCKDGNPNGDPDAANAPRVDPQDMHGLVSDVCLKRKIRNYVLEANGGEEPFDIFVRQGSILNESITQAHKDLGHEVDGKAKKATRDQVKDARAKMCHRYYDVRTFGAVMSTGTNAGQVRGPVQLSFSRSLDPILPMDISITRMAVTEAKELDAPNQTMGRKNLIPYGLYRCHGFISANLARDTGFSDDDLDLLWQTLQNMFDLDRSASRGTMAPQKLIVFKHQSVLGNAPAHKLFERITVTRKEPVQAARQFSDYEVSINRNDLPENVELVEML